MFCLPDRAADHLVLCAAAPVDEAVDEVDRSIVDDPAL